MATTSMDITSFVGKLLEQDDVDALREGVRVLAQAVMETEVSSQIGAAPYERSTERTAYRNGYRTRRWDTRVGTIELKIPKVTAGVYFPPWRRPHTSYGKTRLSEAAFSVLDVHEGVREHLGLHEGSQVLFRKARDRSADRCVTTGEALAEDARGSPDVDVFPERLADHRSDSGPRHVYRG